MLPPCRNDIAGAPMVILDNTPYGPDVGEAKVRIPHKIIFWSAKAPKAFEHVRNACLRISSKELTLSTLLKTINSTKFTKITSVIGSVSPDVQDTLIKCVYQGMAVPGWGDQWQGFVGLAWEGMIIWVLFLVIDSPHNIRQKWLASAVLSAPWRMVGSYDGYKSTK